jgi:hypothetical protein
MRRKPLVPKRRTMTTSILASPWLKSHKTLFFGIDNKQNKLECLPRQNSPSWPTFVRKATVAEPTGEHLKGFPSTWIGSGFSCRY